MGKKKKGSRLGWKCGDCGVNYNPEVRECRCQVVEDEVKRDAVQPGSKIVQDILDEFEKPATTTIKVKKWEDLVPTPLPPTITYTPPGFGTGTLTIECKCHLKKEQTAVSCPLHDVQAWNTNGMTWYRAKEWEWDEEVGIASPFGVVWCKPM
jgi:hypothetical protein